jgi:hypothetical protein
MGLAKLYARSDHLTKWPVSSLSPVWLAQSRSLVL